MGATHVKQSTQTQYRRIISRWHPQVFTLWSAVPHKRGCVSTQLCANERLLKKLREIPRA